VRIELSVDAVSDIAAAALWYDRQRPGLGSEFEAAVDAKLAEMAANPGHFGPYEAGGVTRPYQRAILDGFPYVIVFEIEDDSLFVYAVTHGARRPGHWENR